MKITSILIVIACIHPSHDRVVPGAGCWLVGIPATSPGDPGVRGRNRIRNGEEVREGGISFTSWNSVATKTKRASDRPVRSHDQLARNCGSVDDSYLEDDG